jgi:hypothetical protein
LKNKSEVITLKFCSQIKSKPEWAHCFFLFAQLAFHPFCDDLVKKQQDNSFQVFFNLSEALFDMIDLHTNKLQTLNAESKRRFGKKSANSSKRKN